MIRIGGRELVFSAALIIPENEFAEIEFLIGSWTMKAKIAFVDDGKETESEITFTPSEDLLVVTFTNWRSALGGGLKLPVTVATLNDGRLLKFLSCLWKIGEIFRIDVSFLLEANK